MRSFAPLRLAAHLCLYAAVVCVFAPFRADWALFALLAAGALAAGLAAVRCRSARVRLLLGLAPAPLLLLASGWPSLAAGALALVYCAAVLAAGRFILELWQYRREVVVLLLLSVLTVALTAPEDFRVLPWSFAAACAGLSLLALRVLRMRRASTPAWEAGSVGVFLLPLAGGALLGAGIWAAIPALRYLVKGVGAVFGAAIALWNTIWTWLLRGVDWFGENSAATETTVSTEFTEEATQVTVTASPGLSAEFPELRIPWGILLAVAGGFLLLVLLLLLLRFLRRGETPAEERTGEDLVLEASPEAPKRVRTRRRRRTAKTNRARVRALYQEYLRFLRTNGVQRRPGDTTAEISDASSELLLQSDEQLRSLYRKARYSSEEISDEELRLAAETLKRLTAEENLRNPHS